MLGPILYAVIFLGILMIAEGIYLLIFGKSISREKKRQPSSQIAGAGR